MNLDFAPMATDSLRSIVEQPEATDDAPIDIATAQLLLFGWQMALSGLRLPWARAFSTSVLSTRSRTMVRFHARIYAQDDQFVGARKWPRIGNYVIDGLLSGTSSGWCVFFGHEIGRAFKVVIEITRFCAGAVEQIILRKRLKHENIAPYVTSVCCWQGNGPLLGVITQHGDGPRLSDHISKLKQNGLKFDENKSITCWKQIACALRYLHINGVVHGNLTPRNIMFKYARCDGLFVSLFNSRLSTSEEYEGGLIGSWAYKAPEVLEGEGDPPNPKSDIWSLGVVLFELTTLNLPFGATKLEVLGKIEDYDDRLKKGDGTFFDRIKASALLQPVQLCLAVDPEARPSSDQVIKLM